MNTKSLNKFFDLLWWWKPILWLAIVVGIIFIVANAISTIIDQWNGIMYVVQDSITIAWDQSAGADYYEVQLIWLDQNPPLVMNAGTTQDTQMVITKPKVGHWYFRVRACNSSGCSDWSESIDETKTEIGKPIRIYFKLAPASGIVIQ